MDKKYFCVVRVYPKTADGYYVFNRMTQEFLDMIGYERWISLRNNKELNEEIDVYILTDLDIDDVVSTRSDLNEYALEYYSNKSELDHKYFNVDDTNMTREDYDSQAKELFETACTEFTSYLESTFTKFVVENE